MQTTTIKNTNYCKSVFFVLLQNITHRSEYFECPLLHRINPCRPRWYIIIYSHRANHDRFLQNLCTSLWYTHKYNYSCIVQITNILSIFFAENIINPIAHTANIFFFTTLTRADNGNIQLYMYKNLNISVSCKSRSFNLNILACRKSACHKHSRITQTTIIYLLFSALLQNNIKSALRFANILPPCWADQCKSR